MERKRERSDPAASVVLVAEAHRLVVYMDPDGVVGDYEYERSEKPTKRVY